MIYSCNHLIDLEEGTKAFLLKYRYSYNGVSIIDVMPKKYKDNNKDTYFSEGMLEIAIGDKKWVRRITHPNKCRGQYESIFVASGSGVTERDVLSYVNQNYSITERHIKQLKPFPPKSIRIEPFIQRMVEFLDLESVENIYFDTNKKVTLSKKITSIPENCYDLNNIYIDGQDIVFNFDSLINEISEDVIKKNITDDILGTHLMDTTVFEDERGNKIELIIEAKNKNVTV